MTSKKTQADRSGQAQAVEDGRNPPSAAMGVEVETASPWRTKAQPKEAGLMEAVVSPANMQEAYKRVCGNKGSAGVDGIGVAGFKAHLERHWPAVKARLLVGEYVPAPVRRVDITKPQGGVRTLGIPTLLDRLIQQALHQVLSEIFEPEFSESSFGFRPGRNAHQAVKQARQHVAAGCYWVVDLDLERFFDRVNHDILMGRVSRKVNDWRVLKLIRRYLKAGMMADGLVTPRREGTPQGSPLSPLLSNILLTELDRELERRGHRFCRYADDCNIYVRSETAGLKLMASLEVFLATRLKLKVNQAKSAVARPSKRQFLGYTIVGGGRTIIRISMLSRQRFKAKVRALLRGAHGRTLPYTVEQLNRLLRGWSAYFKLAAEKTPLVELDQWIRHRLRCIIWRQWKRVYTRARYLMKRGLDEVGAWTSATNGRGPWWNSGASHMNLAFPVAYFSRLGLVSLYDNVQRLRCLP